MDVACDACCIINFLAAERILSEANITNARRPKLYIPSEVARESLYLLQPNPNAPNELIKTPIDLNPFLDSAALTLCTITTEEENALFVRLAIQVDDGEAACLAIAKCRGMAVATDDRPASRLAAELAVPVINTVQYLRQWGADVQATSNDIANAITRIQRFARFIPRRDAADAEWWFENAS